MSRFRYTLLTDGSSDRCLAQIINWVLESCSRRASLDVVGQFADLRELRNPPQELPSKISKAVELFPCDVLFVHRDAEHNTRDRRVFEIERAAEEARASVRYLPLVPVRMTEAWLLIDESAIRRAADNPNGKVSLDLPLTAKLEQVPDPKKVLDRALVAASEKSGRRLKRFERDLSFRRQRVAALIDDFSPLRELDAFRAFEKATRLLLRDLS